MSVVLIADQCGEHIPLRAEHLAQRDQRALHVEQGAELLVGGLLQDLVLQLVDPVVEPGEHREVPVDERVEHPVQQLTGRAHSSGCWRSSVPRLRSAGWVARCTVTRYFSEWK
jgi:hypothetical protein